MSHVTFSDWDGLARHGIHELDLRHRSGEGLEISVRTALGEWWVPIDAESFATADGIADVYFRAQQAAAKRWGEIETERSVGRLKRLGYTVIPPEGSE